MTRDYFDRIEDWYFGQLPDAVRDIALADALHWSRDPNGRPWIISHVPTHEALEWPVMGSA